jgi:hypothetical protein
MILTISQLSPPRSKPGKASSLQSARVLHLPNDSLSPLWLRTLPDRCSFRSPRRNGRRFPLLLTTADAEAARLALSLRAGEGAVQPWCRAALAIGALAWAISIELAMRDVKVEEQMDKETLLLARSMQHQELRTHCFDPQLRLLLDPTDLNSGLSCLVICFLTW